MRTILVLVSVLFLAAGQVAAQPASSSTATAAADSNRAAIRPLMEVMGTSRMALQAVDGMMAMTKASFPAVPDSLWVEFRRELNADDLLDMSIPVYEKYLTPEEVRGLTRFYETPLGRKLIDVMPQMMQESMAIGARWGQQAMERVQKRLEERGYRRKAG